MKRTELFVIYKSLRDQGKNYHEIARVLGVDPHAVGSYCRKHGLGYTPEELDRQLEQVTDEEWDLKVKAHFGNNFEVVKAMKPDETTERDIIIRCTDCGTMSIISSVTLRGSKQNKGCANCRRIRKEEEKIEKQELKLRQMIARRQARAYQAEFPTCSCGALAPMGHRICEDCRKENERLYRRERDRKKETIRRKRCAGGDWSISLKKLYERDGGVCYLCGRPTDWEDYRQDGDVFIAGGNYPSIDHVIPLSRGGTHQWDNVKLAHFFCNSCKSDSIAAPSQHTDD